LFFVKGKVARKTLEVPISHGPVGQKKSASQGKGRKTKLRGVEEALSGERLSLARISGSKKNVGGMSEAPHKHGF